MYFPELRDGAVAGAIADLRGCITHLPAGDDRDAAESALGRIEQGVRQGLALWTALVDDSRDGIFLVEPADGGFRRVFSNRAFNAMTAAPMGADIDNSVSPSIEAGRVFGGCREVVEGSIPVPFLDKIERSECTLELETRLTPIRDANDRCSCIVGVSRDITELRAAERLLRKQNRRLQNILGSISDGFVIVDRDWRITFVNSRGEHMLGRPRATLAGMSLVECFLDLEPNSLRGPTESLVAVRFVEDSSAAYPEVRWLAARAFPSQEGAAVYLQDVSERKQAEHALQQGLDHIQASLDGVVNAMAFAVEMRDPYTGGHQRRVSALACAIARQLGFPIDKVETLRIAGLLHDIGKISIPSEILNRPGRLTEPERVIIRTHAEVGYEILKEIEFASPVALIALQHHERLDGSGYPQGLCADSIIPEARILAIADVVEAMASHRPYRAALGVETALQEVISRRGVCYDDLAVGACLSVFTESGFDFDQLMQTELGRHDEDRTRLGLALA